MIRWGFTEPFKHPCLGFLIWKGGQLLPRLGAGGQRFAQRLAAEAAGPHPARAMGPLTRWTLLSLAPARAAASPDTELSSWLLPWAPPAGRGGGGGGAAPVGGGGTGGGGGGGGPPHERGALAADEGCPGGRTGPETRQGGVVRFRPPAGPPWGRRGSGGPGWTHTRRASLALGGLSSAPTAASGGERKTPGGLSSLPARARRPPGRRRTSVPAVRSLTLSLRGLWQVTGGCRADQGTCRGAVLNAGPCPAPRSPLYPALTEPPGPGPGENRPPALLAGLAA